MLARVIENTIVEIHKGFANYSVHQCFHPALLAQCIPVPDGADVGWVRQEDGTWAPPATTDTVTDTGTTA